MYQHGDEIRRADFRLRCQYPEIETVIYKVSLTQYYIYCKGYEGEFSELSEIFNRKIRLICSPVSLSQTIPDKYEEIVKPITFDNPVDSFRASTITEPDVNNLIKSKFNDIEIVRIEHHPGINYAVEILVDTDTSNDRMTQMQKFLATALSTDNITVRKALASEGTADCDDRQEESVSAHSDSVAQAMLKMLEVPQLFLDKKLKWMADEADYWFSHAEDIYLNKHDRDMIPYYRSGQKNCFLECSLHGNIDIRKMLFLYETVYLGMPLDIHLDKFLNEQRMTKSELLQLVEMGKVVLVLTNNESRYDIQLLNDVYEVNPLGIVGRRGINVLLASYLSEQERRYSVNHPDIYEYAKDLYRVGRKTGNRQLVTMADSFTYPFRAKANSFCHLNTTGLPAFPGYGVNTIYESLMEDLLSKEQYDNLQLVFSLNAYPIHLAMALNATYFPYQETDPKSGKINSDFYVADLMENLLSMYWYNEYQIDFIKETRAAPGLELFECENSLSVVDVARSADDWNTPEKFGKILDAIAKLPLDKQNEMIREYNHLLLEISRQSDRISVTDMVITGLGFMPLNDALSASVNIFDLLRSIVTSREPVREYLEKRQYKAKMEKAEQRKIDAHTVDDVYLLDKIHKVARLRRRIDSLHI